MDKKTFSKFKDPIWFRHWRIHRLLKGDKASAFHAASWISSDLGSSLEHTFFHGVELTIKSKCNLLYLMTRDEVAG